MLLRPPPPLPLPPPVGAPGGAAEQPVYEGQELYEYNIFGAAANAAAGGGAADNAYADDEDLYVTPNSSAQRTDSGRR